MENFNLTNKKLISDLLSKPYVWGKIKKIHEIGEYVIVEYSEPNYRNVENNESIVFHPFINGKDTNRGYDTLDGAIVGVIARKHDGINTKADRYFMKAIKPD